MTRRPGSPGGDHCAIVVLSGEIDIANRQEIVRVIGEAIQPNTTEINLDMSAVEFIDCAGLAGILQGRHLAAKQGCHLRVVSMTSAVRRLLDLTETLPLLSEPDRPAAGADLAERRLETPGLE